MRKAIKKIVALGIGATMLGATILGAQAYTLADYPAPFVENGVANTKLVVGKDAKASDSIGATAIGFSLQAASVSEEAVEGESTTTTVEGGAKIETGGNNLIYAEALNNVEARFTDDEFPVFLKDGTVSDEDNTNSGTDYDYKQRIYMSDDATAFGRPNTGVVKTPIVYLDTSSGPVINLSLEFDQDTDITNLDDSEAFTLFGKKFTVGQATADTGDIILYGSDESVTVNVGETTEVEVAGESYTIEVLGGNAENSQAIVKINDQQKTVTADNSYTIDGLSVLVEDVYINTIGSSSVGVNLFLGSDKYTIQDGADKTFKLNDDTYKGVKTTTVKTGSTNDAVRKIIFQLRPGDVDNDETGKDWDWISAGATYEDPLFGLKVNVIGPEPDLMADERVMVEMTGGSELTFSFTNEENDEYEVTVYKESSGTVVGADDYVNGGTTLAEDAIFFLNDAGSNNVNSNVYQVISVTADAEGTSDNETVIAKYGDSSSEKTYKEGDTIGDTNATVSFDAGNVTLGTPAQTYVYAKGGLKLHFGPPTGAAAGNFLTILEDQWDDDDETTAMSMLVNLSVDTSNSRIEFASDPLTPTVSSEDTDADVEYYLTQYGTYIARDTSNDYDYLKIYYPTSEVYYGVFVSTPESTVVTSTSGTTTQVINPIDVGAAVFDDEVTVGAENLIIVGGPCINTAAADAMSLPQGSCGEASMVPMNKGLVKLVAHEGDTYSLVVAGWEAEDTRRAANVVAKYGTYLVGVDKMEQEVYEASTGETELSDVTVVEEEPAVEEEVVEEEATEETGGEEETA